MVKHMEIKLLDNATIDKIAAGEVVERPLNVVKELVENSIDAGATSISVEIKNGGVDLIRVTDNGFGIDKNQVKTAFLRHATSKLRVIDDLDRLNSLGFRGEALSSISAVSKTEMITKTENSLLGIHTVVEGGRLDEFSEIGAPKGTTVIVKNLFYNTPVRKKFLKSVMTEGSMVENIMEKIALSHPEVSFSFINNQKERFSTSGNGELSDVIYRIFGKDIYDRLLKVDVSADGLKLYGYICRPEYNLGTRENEIFFVNKRYVKSKILTVSLEEGFKGYLMQHRFPFCVLMLSEDPSMMDINVHPQKLEVKFSNAEFVSDFIRNAINETLKKPELIPNVTLEESPKRPVFEFESVDAITKLSENEVTYEPKTEKPQEIKTSNKVALPFETVRINTETKETKEIKPTVYEQVDLFENHLINEEHAEEYKIIGQVFETYWLITLKDNLYIVDQHAAHEKVNYENFVSQYRNNTGCSQSIMPPVVIHLTAKQENVFLKNLEIFERIGFEIEEFGEKSYAIRSVPMNLYASSTDDLLLGLLDELMEKESVDTPEIVLEKLASMSCKAAIKGNMRISEIEMKSLMEQLMKLENPYNCPHGRPVFINITKTELEKKFKRIV